MYKIVIASLLSSSIFFSSSSMAEVGGATEIVAVEHLAPIVIEGSTAEVLAPEVSKEIGRHLTYPRVALLRKMQGVATVTLVLDQHKVIDSKVAASTGFNVLDDQAIKASYKMDPSKIFPAEYVGREIEISVPVSFFIR